MLVAADARAAERLARPGADPNRRILVKGGTIVSLERQVGAEQGDVLIRGKRIVTVTPNIEPSGAQIIDASNTIIIPGFVYAHPHIRCLGRRMTTYPPIKFPVRTKKSLLCKEKSLFCCLGKLATSY